ncbi:MAG TPA: S-methyl-5-thioribose-1-phosphate isomerase, partial [Planctomycetota bacterium]|nr:S-methyl-5-thioribose-1-phosphate isomerase [Planctomycetota bacterium]
MTSPPRALEWIGDADGFLRVLDQTALPDAETTVDLRTPDDVIAALRRLAVRGAPAIGVAGAYAVVLGLRGAPDSADALSRVVADVCAAVESARPTAVNLAWAVRRVRRAVDGAAGSAATRRAAFAEARAIEDEDRTACARMAAYGATLIGPGERVLTCCNTGALATAGEGTALGAILATARAGRRPTVYACETRPLLQGSRLTMWELGRAGVDAVLLCDNAAAEAMRRGLADRVMVGADRVARNGDVANKIGTYGLATLARAHGVPFHVVAP